MILIISIIVVILMPGMIYIKGNDYPIYHYKNILTIIFMLIVSSIGLCTIFCTIKKLYPIENTNFSFLSIFNQK